MNQELERAISEREKIIENIKTDVEQALSKDIEKLKTKSKRDLNSENIWKGVLTVLKGDGICRNDYIIRFFRKRWLFKKKLMRIRLKYNCEARYLGTSIVLHDKDNEALLNSTANLIKEKLQKDLPRQVIKINKTW